MPVYPSYVDEAQARQRRRWIAGAVVAVLLALLGALALVVFDAPVADASGCPGGKTAAPTCLQAGLRAQG